MKLRLSDVAISKYNIKIESKRWIHILKKTFYTLYIEISVFINDNRDSIVMVNSESLQVMIQDLQQE